MSRRLFFVINDKAGRSNEDAVREAIDQQLVENEFEHEMFIRRRKGQSRRDATRQALSDGYDTIVAVGGDGTVSRVVDEMVGSNATLGIIPTGTANLIARELQIPLDVNEAMSVLVADHHRCHIDGMEIDGRRYFSHVSLGVYSKIAKLESSTQKQWFGRGIYIWHLFREIRNQSRWTFHLDVDGRKRSVRASMVMAANIGATGLAGLEWGERIGCTDGAIDLCIVRARSLPEYGKLIWQSFWGTTDSSQKIEYDRATTHMTISTKSDMPVRADGKIIGDRHVKITVASQCVSVIVPDDSSDGDIMPSTNS